MWHLISPFITKGKYNLNLDNDTLPFVEVDKLIKDVFESEVDKKWMNYKTWWKRSLINEKAYVEKYNRNFIDDYELINGRVVFIRTLRYIEHFKNLNNLIKCFISRKVKIDSIDENIDVVPNTNFRKFYDDENFILNFLYGKVSGSLNY